MLNSLSDLLTQKANVYARAQTWDAYGAEVYGDEATLYSNEPCLLVPLSPERSALAGLDFGQRGYTAFFSPSRNITHDSNGQAYQEVRVVVRNSAGTDISYMAMGPQQRFGDDMGIDDTDHIEVPVVRRDSA